METFDTNSISNPSGNTPPPAPEQQAAGTPQDSAQNPAPQFQSPPSNITAPAAPQQSQQQNGQPILSNPSAQTDEHADHPAVKKAGLLRSIAETLAGGPRSTVHYDENGNRVVTQTPLDSKSIGWAIALTALEGGLAGLAGGRGKGAGTAGLSGLNLVAGQRQQAQQRQEDLAQQEFANRSASLARKAQTFEINSRTLLNTAEAEKYGADAIDKMVEINRASGVLDIDSALLDNNGQPMTQAELMDAMKSGKVNSTDKIGPIVGRVQVTDKDGNSRWEATHLIVKDPNTLVPLTQEMWDRYSAANVPGFPKTNAKISQGVEVKLSTIQRANEIVAAHTLADFRLGDIRQVLAGTPYADKIPAAVDFSKPGVDAAMQRFQKYVSHSNQHGMDIFESLQAMGADKRDPKTGQMQPNGDAKFVDAVAQAFGGWGVLEAVHNQIAANKKTATEFSVIDSEAKANGVIAAPGKFTKDQITEAKNFLTLSQQQGARKTGEEARARAVAEGKDVEAMLKTGVNPITGERLTLANAPDSMLVDAKGRPVPQNMQSFYKPSQNERQTGDTARQALAISADLRAAVQKNPNLVGPLLGNSKAGLAKLGFGDAEAQKFLDDISFLQSAATKVHTGRFSSEILHKMGAMLKSGMNSDQFVGGLNSIDQVMQRYAKEDQLVTVADYKQMQETPASVSNTQNTQGPPASLLKEGVDTTFANGQVWTLRGGQPVQVK
ncbi:MAG TPA: hypothetical protein VJW20_07325 [Candidatus Angelobacter sp.]|nr:hypothetical protein [Candidatus Angelobacter sp.]